MSNCNENVKVKVLVTQSCPTLCDHMDCSLPGSSVHGISREEYWSGLPFPSPGDLPDPGIEPESPALQADSLPFEPPIKINMKNCIQANYYKQKFKVKSFLIGASLQED